MNNEEMLAKLAEEGYQEVFGVKKRTFEEIRKGLEADYEQKHKKEGARRN